MAASVRIMSGGRGVAAHAPCVGRIVVGGGSSRHPPCGRSARVGAMAEVETSRAGGVLTITLNRPDVLNAFNAAMHAALAAALRDARDPDVRAVVLTGAGRGFC